MDTMHYWWPGAKKGMSLAEMFCAMGLESSKTDTINGSRVVDIYLAGSLAKICDHNLHDIRATRRTFELMATNGNPNPSNECPEDTAANPPATQIMEARTQ
jgi:hypothetical protein